MKALCSISILIVGIIYGVINTAQGRCIQTYSDLEQSIFSKDSNVEKLQRSFYPVNKEPSNAVEIHYHFDDQSLPQPYRFRWSSSRVFGLLRPKVLQDLSFNVYSADVPTVDIEFNPICENISIHYMLVNWEKICSDVTEASDSLVLLNEITAKVSNIYNTLNWYYVLNVLFLVKVTFNQADALKLTRSMVHTLVLSSAIVW